MRPGHSSGYEPLPGGRGQATLTEFRARIAAEQAAATAANDRMALPQLAATLLPHQRRTVAVRGRVVVPRPAAAVASTVVRRTVEPPRLDQFVATHSRIAEREVRALAAKQLRVVLRALAKLRTSQLAGWAEHRACLGTEAQGCTHERIAADDVFDATYWRRQTAEQWEGWMTSTYMDAAARSSTALGVSLESFDERVLAAMDTRREDLADQVTQTTRHAIDSGLLAVAAEEGWSVDDAADAMRKVFDDLDKRRAETIARTEVLGGYSQVSYLAAQESGVVTGRRWHTAKDERVRPSHSRMDGELVRGSDLYSNGLRYPHDPNGPPSETVDCRCVELYELED